MMLDDGTSHEVILLELSDEGCKLLTALPLSTGVRIRLSIPDIGELGAQVCWTDAGEAGLSFQPPLPRSMPRELRNEERTSLSADVSLRRAGRTTYTVRASDISPTGCRLDFVERPATGERIFVKFTGLDGLEAEVRWVDGFTGGVEFARPIHSAVFERLLANLR